MPYRRRRFQKKQGFFQKRYRVYAPAVRQLASDISYVKSLVNSEPKNVSTTNTSLVSWTGTILSPCLVPQGVTDNDRTGDRILPRYFTIKLGIVSGATSSFLRVITFRWWGAAATGGAPAAPTAAQILRNTGTVYSPFSHLHEDIVGSRGDRERRIEVLRSDLIPSSNVSDVTQILEYNIKMNGKNVNKKEHIEFDGSATAEPVSGGIYILLISHTVGASLTVYSECKLTFYDN